MEWGVIISGIMLLAWVCLGLWMWLRGADW